MMKLCHVSSPFPEVHEAEPQTCPTYTRVQSPPRAAAGRVEQFSVVENLVLKIIPEKYPVNHFKEKTKKCSGAI